MCVRLFIIILFINSIKVHSENAPLTYIEDNPQTLPGVVLVPVKVQSFDDIGSVYLSIDYDYSKLQLTGAEPHPEMPTFLHSDSDLGTGYHRITMGWYGNSLTLPDGSTIMALTFTYTQGFTELAFYDNGPSCEYAGGDGQVLNDLPTWQYFNNGWICGELDSPGPITGEEVVCQGRHTVSYSVVPMANASDYIWQVPPEEATILCGEHTNLILVNWKENAQPCNLQVWCTNPCGVTSPVSSLSVTVNSKPIISAGMDFVITYGTSTVLQGFVTDTGAYSYYWSPEELLIDPTELNPTTHDLFSTTEFTLQVTNLETGCQEHDDVVVYLYLGPLTINPTASEDTTCAGSDVTLHAYPSGGTGNFTFLWTSAPAGWSSTEETTSVSPDTTTIYYLMVNDGVITIYDSVLVTVLEELSANISGSDTLCGNNDYTTLTFDLTGEPPWDFVYTFELQSVHVADQMTTPYELVTNIPGTYSISFVKNYFCDGTGSGNAIIDIYPIPPAPVISPVENTLISNLSWGNQWYKDDELIPGATGVSHTATETGNYYDIVTRFGCVSDSSNNIYIVFPGIIEKKEYEWEIYPNPAHKTFFIKYVSSKDEDCLINIYSLEKRIIKTMHHSLLSGNNEIRVNTADIPAGLYILTLESESHSLCSKLILLP